jgi:hypothetical protein
VLTALLAVWNLIKGSRAAKIGLAVLVLAILVLIFWPKLIDTYGRWKATIEAIRNPAQTKVIYKDRIIERVQTVTKEGKPIIIEHIREREGEQTESKPVIPTAPAPRGKTIYLTGSAGTSQRFNELDYGVGAGVFLNESISIGVRGEKQGDAIRGFVDFTLYF